jgi:hypothetical protein
MRRMQHVCRTDWFRVLTDLQYAACPHSDVAAYLGIPQSTVRGWKDGSEPNHHDGSRLLELWQQITGRGYEDRPRTGRAETRDSAKPGR